jgi:hypothetical protein
MRKREGFFNLAGFPNDPASTGAAAIQQKFKDTLPNVIYNNDPNLDLAKLTSTVLPSLSISDSPLKNEWKQTTVPTPQFNSMQAACENVGNGDQFAHLSSLASSVDTSSRLRCGWVYNRENYAQGRGALGIIKGPLKTTASGTWMWNLNAAKEKYHTDICSGITNCGDIGASMYQGRCGWCKKSGRAVPIKDGEAAYPFNPKTACNPKRLVTSAGACSEGFVNPSACTPSASGSLSRDCLLQKVIGAGCSDAGSMYQALQSGSDNDYLSQLRQQQSWSVYQSRATAPLDETALTSGKITIANALNNFNAVQQQAASELNGGLQFAARDLCFKKGSLDAYDFCTEIDDSKPGPFILDCLQKAFLSAGGQTTGRAYPSNSNISTWNALGVWSKVKSAIQELIAKTRSSDRITQENAMIDFYGITLENKQVPLQPPPPPSLTVRLGQNCDNHSGWQKELGVGDWSAGSGFPGDASYITVPAGLTAKLTNAGGTDQVVKGPGEFNFCSRGGFNDSVKKISISSNVNSPTYIMKDFVQYSQAGTDLPNQPMMGSVNDCSIECNNNANCLGFSWVKGKDVNSKSNCWLKQNINNPTASQPYVTYVRQ